MTLRSSNGSCYQDQNQRTTSVSSRAINSQSHPICSVRGGGPAGHFSSNSVSMETPFSIWKILQALALAVSLRGDSYKSDTEPWIWPHTYENIFQARRSHTENKQTKESGTHRKYVFVSETTFIRLNLRGSSYRCKGWETGRLAAS